jgi:hypothetical protein
MQPLQSILLSFEVTAQSAMHVYVFGSAIVVDSKEKTS